MLEIIFVDIPLLLMAYAGFVFVILRFLEPRVIDSSLEVDEDPRFISPKGKIGDVVSHDAGSMDYEEHSVSPETGETKDPTAITLVNLPTDSQLKRHYLSNLLTIATSIHTRPEEATLKRHHRQLVMSLTEDMLQNPEKIELYEDMVREKKRLADLCSQDAKNAVLMAEPVHYPAPVSSDFRHPNPKRNRVDIPEEVTLRRHFIQNFVAKLEENSPRPTDNTLVRHYNQWLDSEVENLIYQSG